MKTETTWKPGDVAWLEENNWCGDRTSVTVNKVFKDGNVHLTETHSGKRRMSHIKNLWTKEAHK